MLDVKALLVKLASWIEGKDYKNYGDGVSIIAYASASNLYTVPQDGVIQLNCNYRSGSYIMLYQQNGTVFAEASAPGNANAGGNTIITVPVYKGMKFYVTRSSTYSYAYFIPLTT